MPHDESNGAAEHEEVYMFTDPQVHSVTDAQYGIGNCGAEGIEVF